MNDKAKTNSTSNQLVKAKFSATLKEMAAKMPLEAISVSALVRQSGLSRSTFYYHFLDIYDLINQTAEQDIFVPLERFIREKEFRWRGITRYCLSIMDRDRKFYSQAVRMEGPNCLSNYLQKRNLDMWRLLIRKYMDYTGADIGEDMLDFMVRYTAHSVASMTIAWARDGMKIPVEQMASMDELATDGIYGTINEKSGIKGAGAT